MQHHDVLPKEYTGIMTPPSDRYYKLAITASSMLFGENAPTKKLA